MHEEYLTVKACCQKTKFWTLNLAELSAELWKTSFTHHKNQFMLFKHLSGARPAVSEVPFQPAALGVSTSYELYMQLNLSKNKMGS